MSKARNIFVKTSAAIFVVLAAVAAAISQTPVDGTAVKIKIKNFGRMDNRFYRGAQPKEADYKDLKTLGVQTVIDLQDDPTSYEKKAVEALGMRYINIPMSDTSYPKEASIDTFLKLINDPATGTMYVHCAGGRHRTGVIGAVYRFNVNHWNYDQVYSEMKQYDFYTRWGHGDMKTYVQDYARRIETNAAAAAASSNK